MKKESSRAGGAVLAVTAVLAAGLCLYMPDTVAKATKSALSLCAARVIPSVFPFSVLSSLFVASGGAEALDGLASPLCRRLFGLEHGISALLQGLFFGFPLGALTVGAEYRAGAISQKEASRLLAFVSCASPTFPVFVVGVGYFGSAATGLLIWGVQSAVSLFIGVMLSFPRKTEAAASAASRPAAKNEPRPGAMSLFTSAITGGARVMLNVCGSVTFFSVASAIVSRLLSNVTSSPFPALAAAAAFEFSTGTAAAHAAFASGEISRAAAAALCAFSIGSAGLSVLFQTASVTEGIPLLPHVAGKLVTGAVTAAVVYAASGLPAFAAASAPAFAPSDGAAVNCVFAAAAAAVVLFAAACLPRKKSVAKKRGILYNEQRIKRGSGGADER